MHHEALKNTAFHDIDFTIFSTVPIENSTNVKKGSLIGTCTLNLNTIGAYETDKRVVKDLEFQGENIEKAYLRVSV